MYVAVKPIRFDQWYYAGDEIPNSVISPEQERRILASEKVKLVKAKRRKSSTEKKGNGNSDSILSDFVDV